MFWVDRKKQFYCRVWSQVYSASGIDFEIETLLLGVGVDDDSFVHHRHPWNQSLLLLCVWTSKLPAGTGLRPTLEPQLQSHTTALYFSITHTTLPSWNTDMKQNFFRQCNRELPPTLNHLLIFILKPGGNQNMNPTPIKGSIQMSLFWWIGRKIFWRMLVSKQFLATTQKCSRKCSSLLSQLKHLHLNETTREVFQLKDPISRAQLHQDLCDTIL